MFLSDRLAMECKMKLLKRNKTSMLPGRLETESSDYRKLRDELLEAEIALMHQRERVAALRRNLPLDTGIHDYEFHEGPART
jgi:predicted dithiol-disulfide oxidoreductase (DUF899 family)